MNSAAQSFLRVALGLLFAEGSVAACGGNVDGPSSTASGGGGDTGGGGQWSSGASAGAASGGQPTAGFGASMGLGGIGATGPSDASMESGTGGTDLDGGPDVWTGSGGTTSAGGYTGVGCFVAGTRVATPRGWVAIELLRMGEQVLAFDVRDQRLVPRRISAVMVHPEQVAGELRLPDGLVLGVTGNHPIYLPDVNRYVRADTLSAPSRLLTLGGEQRITSAIAARFVHSSVGITQTVYNIEVEGLHNYFAEGVLVHNKSGGMGPNCIPKYKDWGIYCLPEGPCLDTESTAWDDGGGSVPSEAADASLSEGGAHAEGGLDSGLADSSQDANGDSGVLPVTYLERQFCAPTQKGAAYHVAFDVYNSGVHPSFSSVWGVQACGGIESLKIHYPINPPSGWHTICFSDFGPSGRQFLSLVADQPVAMKHLRLVKECACQARTERYDSCTQSYSLYGAGDCP